MRFSRVSKLLAASGGNSKINVVAPTPGFKYRMCDRLPGRRVAHVLALAGLAGLATACGLGGPQKEFGESGYIQGFYGGIAGPEPTSVLIGRDVLTSGGSAADAAVAMGLAMAVTYPSQVGIGGGGSCLVHDASLGVTEALNFVPPPGTHTGGRADRPSAVPTMVRGMAALHARYGLFDWRQVVTPAEKLARLGHRVSRAFAKELEPAAKPLFADPEARRIFASESGEPLPEGRKWQQLDLAGVLGRVRGAGAGALYSGPLARQLVQSVQRAGGTLSVEDLRNYRPEWQPTVLVPLGDDEFHFPPPPAAGGPALAQAFRILMTDDRYADASEDERVHLVAEAYKRALADRKKWLGNGFLAKEETQELVSQERVDRLFSDYRSEDRTPGAALDSSGIEDIGVFSGAGFVVADRDGMAVACNLTLFNPFGTGRVAQGTGIVLAAAPGLPGRNPLGLAPMMMTNSNLFTFRFAVASGGGPLGPVASLKVAADTILAKRGLKDAVAAPRILPLNIPDVTLVEEGGTPLAAALEDRDHRTQAVEWLGQTTAIHCPNGIPSDSEELRICQVANDPRGFGLTAVTGQ